MNVWRCVVLVGDGAARLRDGAARLRGWALGPGGLTLALTTAIAAAGALAAGQLPGAALLPAPPLGGWAGLVVLVVALLVAELAQAHVEVRRQAYSFSLTGVPLLLGLLFCPPAVLVAARVGAAAAAFALQRVSPAKFAFNLAAYLLDVSLVVLATHVLSGPRDVLDLQLGLAAYAAMAVVDLLMTCLVLLVIRINSGPLELVDVVDSVVPAVVFVVINAAVGLLVALMAASGSLGELLLVVLVVVVAATYRLHLVLRRRHASLQLVKDFVDLGARTAAQDGPLASVLLSRLREQTRAERAVILVPGQEAEDGWHALAASYEEGAGPPPQRTGRRAEDAALDELSRGDGGTLLVARGRDREHQRWLAAHGLRDAVVCPLEVEGRRGLVVVADRLGETTSFDRDDLSLLQALTGHLEVALRSAWLVDRLRHDARHDALTGLPNLLGMTELAAPALGAEPAPAVLVLSLDRADEVSAVLGHRAADEALVLVARRVELAVPGALVGRTGGAQLAVLLPARTGVPVLADALAAASRVERALEAPVQLSAASVTATASTGVAVAEPGDDLGEVLRRADTARTSGDGTGGTGAVVYTVSMDDGRAERVELLSDLRRALDSDQLMLHYQPKLDLAFGLVTGVEALVRWDHPRLGRLSPDRFVPLAESTGLVEPFTHHLLGVALRQLRAWQDGGVDVSVAVNLSARNVANPALPDLVAAALATAGVPATRLVLELTESTVMGDPARTVPVLERLAAIGVTLSLDDFGTGYSSLSYLQRLPVQELKIDRSFVRGLETTASAQDSAVAAALIRSITALKDALGLRIVAEGVEDAHVLERVRDLGCDVVQGYHVARPAPAEHLDPATTRLTTAPGAALG